MRQAEKKTYIMPTMDPQHTWREVEGCIKVAQHSGQLLGHENLVIHGRVL
jgi:hypothetical protein